MNSNIIPPLIEKNWHSITSHTLSKIQSLLDASRTLLNDMDEEEYGDFIIGTGDPTIAAGLYTFAVEEYGKYLYLKSLKPIDGKYHVNYEKFTDHRSKFEKALSNLPDACKLINLGEKGDNEFYDSDVHDDTIADFETRLRIFYADFDPLFANKLPTQTPSVSAKILKVGVQKLWEIVYSERIKIVAEINKDNS